MGTLSPTSAIVGGILAQDVIKVRIVFLFYNMLPWLMKSFHLYNCLFFY